MPEKSALVLEVLKQDCLVKMSLFEQKEAASTLRHYSRQQVDFSEIRELCRQITAALNRAAMGTLQPDCLRDLKRCGQLIWGHLLTKPVKEKLRATLIPNLILSLDEELISIPWELLYTGEEFLSLKFNLGRLVRTGEQAQPAQYRSFSSILSMLVLANPTGDLKSAYLEGLNIKNQFDRKRRNMRIDFKSTAIDKLYVKKNLPDYDIVHFAGHAEYSAGAPNDSGWILNDAKFGAEDILSLGASASMPSLVFSNACHSAAGLVDTDYQEKNYSLAQAFLFSGVRHYLGAIRKIEDPAGFLFAKEFYSHLLAGSSLGESVRLARLKLIKERGAASIHWASYLLYGDPNFVLLGLAHKPSRKAKKGLWRYRKALAGLAIVCLLYYLYIWLPTLNPAAYYLYLKSQKAYLAGRNNEVIALSGRIIKKDASLLEVYAQLGDTYFRLGEKEKALRYYFDYAFLCEKNKRKKELASSYAKIGWCYFLYADYAKAKEFYDKAYALSRANKDKLGEADVLGKQALLAMEKGDDNLGLELLTRSAEINRQRQHLAGHKYALACDYFNLGLLFRNKEDYTTAEEFYDKSFVLFSRLKMKNELSDYYFNTGEICAFRKDYAKAMELYHKGLKLDEDLGFRFNLPSDYNMIGELYAQMDNLEEAEEYFQRAASSAAEISLAPEAALAYYNLGLLHKEKGRINASRESLRRAQEIYSRIDENKYKETKHALLDLTPD
jgi:CHAT domain-containing protein